MKHRLEAIKKYILAFLQVQFLLSFMSLPVLVAWGLPISCMTAVGNFLFNPFVTAFLFCSSLIFFTELLHIPNTYLIVVLDWITSCWMYCLSFGMQSWLIGFPLIMLPLLFCLAFVALISLQHIHLGKPLAYVSMCTVFLVGIATVTAYLPKPESVEIAYKRKRIVIRNDAGKLHLIDEDGVLAQAKNINSWINYTLLPELLQHFGTQSLKRITYVGTQEKNRKVIDLLTRECGVKEIYQKRAHSKKFDKKR